jgi:hypothetical protein
MLRRVAHIRIDVPEERIASIIRVIRIGDLRAALAVATEALWEEVFIKEPHGFTS